MSVASNEMWTIMWEYSDLEPGSSLYQGTMMGGPTPCLTIVYIPFMWTGCLCPIWMSSLQHLHKDSPTFTQEKLSGAIEVHLISSITADSQKKREMNLRKVGETGLAYLRQTSCEQMSFGVIKAPNACKTEGET
ncbi:hypothetical protein EMCRGX_G021032 [Ephydatia muelleri]